MVLTHHLRPLFQRIVRQSLHQGERLEFAIEKERQNDFSGDKGGKVRFHQGILEVISFLNMMQQ